MAVNELEIEVELESRTLDVEITGVVDFTYGDKEKLDALIPIPDATINALFS